MCICISIKWSRLSAWFRTAKGARTLDQLVAAVGWCKTWDNFVRPKFFVLSSITRRLFEAVIFINLPPLKGIVKCSEGKWKTKSAELWKYITHGATRSEKLIRGKTNKRRKMDFPLFPDEIQYWFDSTSSLLNLKRKRCFYFGRRLRVDSPLWNLHFPVLLILFLKFETTFTVQHVATLLLVFVWGMQGLLGDQKSSIRLLMT